MFALPRLLIVSDVICASQFSAEEISPVTKAFTTVILKPYSKTQLLSAAQALRSASSEAFKMITIQRILCPTDLSQEADEALRYAVALTSACGAKLFLLYCKEGKSGRSENGKATVATSSVFTESLAPHLGLNAFCDLDWQGLVAENVTDVGKAILNEAVSQKIDLIVMRSRRRPHAAILLGSTAETVCRSATCPVLVTHPREREWVGFSTGEIDLQRILVAYDFSSDAEVALNYALSFAQKYQTELHLLHMLTKADQGEPEFAWLQKTENAYNQAAGKLQRTIPSEALPSSQIRTEVRCGKVYQEVLAYAKKHQIDLICLGAHGSDFSLRALFGSNVDRILRQAPCPVLIARPIHLPEVPASSSREIRLPINCKEETHDDAKFPPPSGRTTVTRPYFVHDGAKRT
jgi:nucleotide-binding universal stress UspA family protein